MNVILPEIETDLELWLSAVVDNELDPIQRRQLVRYLDDHPHLWRSCGVAFLDEQVLAAEVPAIDKLPVSESVVNTTSVPESKILRGPVNGKSRMTLALAIAASLVALLCGIGLGNGLGKSDQQEFLAGLDKNRSQVAALTHLLIAERESRKAQSLCSLYPDQPMLIEIQNTGDRAVYLTDRPVSEKMLEGFFAAGHDVEVKPYSPRIATSWMQSMKNPVLAIEVDKKHPLMFAQGERK